MTAPESPASMTPIPGSLDPQGLRLPPGLTFEEWDRVGQTLIVIEEGIQWWIGDWLVYGEQTYGEMYAQAQAITGKSYSTLTKYKYVAERFPIFRRRKHLSWSHHAALASLPPDHQDGWLDAADPGQPDTSPRISARDLRQEVSDREGIDRGPWPPAAPVICETCGRRVFGEGC